MNGYSGAEIAAVCKESAMIALKENMENKLVSMKHLLDAIKVIPPRTSAHLLSIYEAFSRVK